ncbi:PqqD family protein [Novipirellula caenicola]|uniref:PqqD family protein n=1 Tax=Novipirellula caenicola TaxID=1536901 RepID=A0ABP9VR48_9BACT
MTIDTSTKVVPHNDTLFTQLHDGEAVLLHLETHAYYGLNETAARIWQLLSDGLTLGEVCCQLQSEFDVGDAEILQYVVAFAEELSTTKLVELSC